ncbi:MAG: Gfo/Idh/MocA family oxidoreductase [Deltaproteobacteria bacterium]|nr:Gfo/Idh/MocA family oxidoreductase [Deltaproteobacteria bacterium]
MSDVRRVNVAVVGAGYWGRNHVRTFSSLPGSSLTWVCDRDVDRLGQASEMAPAARASTDLEELVSDGELEAVVVATPARTHAEIAERFLEAGKHVLVEKPMALDIEDARRIHDSAREKGLVLMVGHLMVYHPAVDMLRRMIADGELGDVYYLYSQRVNLGTARTDENALWCFGPHDLSIIHELFPAARPTTVCARGHCYLRPPVEDVVFMNVTFEGGMMAQVQLSWLDPHKERRMTIVGSRRMVTFDDVSPSEKIRVFDKGYDHPPEYGSFGEFLTLRDGDVWAPKVPFAEPLRLEAEHFLDCVRTNATPRTDGEEGLWIVRLLVAAQSSMELGGEPVELT